MTTTVGRCAPRTRGTGTVRPDRADSREREVLTLVAAGMSNVEIAATNRSIPAVAEAESSAARNDRDSRSLVNSA